MASPDQLYPLVPSQAALIRLRDALAATYVQRSCLPCDHFDEASEQCRLVNKRPPARVIAYGCEQFDYIPF